MSTKTIKVNSQDILIFTEGHEKYVAIKPICEAIGVDYDKQLERINRDEILNQLTPIWGATGTDGKTYKMRVISLRYVFGWLFTININKVKPEIKEAMIKYKMECYNALFDMFTKRAFILQKKTQYQIEIETLEEELKQDERFKRIQELKASVSDATKRLNNLDKDVVAEQLDLFKNKEN